MSRYTGPARIRIHGDQGAGAAYVGLARKLLGEQMAIHVDAYDSSRGLASQSHVSKTYTPKPTEQIARKASLPNGVNVRVQYNTFMPVIDIWVPEGVEPVKAIEYRGLLRALQDEDDPCEPLREPEGEPGEEDFDPGEFSELHPLYDPEDGDQQWLEYPADGLSQEFNPLSNYPLPPLGGTWVMDMIGAPFDPRAFNNKPPLATCKMLVTGGGRHNIEKQFPNQWGKTFLDGSGEEVPYIEIVGNQHTYNCPPRIFRIGRMNPMPGWPWLSDFARLVSASAVLEAPFNNTRAEAHIKIEFLRLNGEPFEPDEEAYLDPLEIDIVQPWNISGVWRDHVIDTWWYELSILSLNRTGSKAVIGLHQLGGGVFHGAPMDFIVLDLENEGDKYTVIDRFDHVLISEVNSDFSVGTPVTPVYDVVEHSDSPYLHPNIALNVHFGEVVESETVGNAASCSGTLHRYYKWIFYLLFDADDKLRKLYCAVNEIVSESGSQELSVISGEQLGAPLQGFLGVATFQIGVSYSQYDVVYEAGIIGGFATVNVFVARNSHFSTTTNRPRLSDSSCTAVDHPSSEWRFVYGRRCASQSPCVWQDWNLDADGGEVYRRSNRLYATINSVEVAIWDARTGTTLVINEESVSGIQVTQGNTAQFVSSREVDFSIWSDMYESTEEPEELFYILYEFEESFDRRIKYITPNSFDCFTNGYISSQNLINVGGVSAERKDVRSYTFRAYDKDNELVDEFKFSSDDPDLVVCSTYGLRNNIFDQTITRGISDFEGYTGPQSLLFLAGNMWSCSMNVPIASIDGTGVAFSYGASTSGFYTGTCGGSFSLGRLTKRRERAILTASSLEVDYNFDNEDAIFENTVAFSSGSPIANDKVRATTDPGRFAPNEANEGVLFKPVIGPELGILCAHQQVSYIGWLYPNELEDEENE